MTKIAIGLMSAVALFCASPSSAQIKAIWLTHNSEDPASIVVNWQRVEPGSSIVYIQKGNDHVLCGEGLTDCIAPYVELVRSHPDVFRTIPFMPVLGDHDKEIRPRGTKYPPLAVYDTNAVVYRKFFELPGKEWAWKFLMPEHDVTFVALDINHAGDMGTTWQSSRSYKVTAEQFRWYTEVMNKEKNFIVTLSNERNDRVIPVRSQNARRKSERCYQRTSSDKVSKDPQMLLSKYKLRWVEMGL